MAGVCVADGREGETMGADEGRDGRKQEEEGGGVALFSALQLLFSWIITLQPPHPLTPKTKGTPPVWKQE